jgi:hypothetical protein
MICKFVQEQSFIGPSDEAIAWQLRQAGILGFADRTRNNRDHFNAISQEALRLAIRLEYVKIEGTVGSYKLTPCKLPTVSNRIIRKYEAVDSTPELLHVNDATASHSPSLFKHIVPRAMPHVRELALH